MEKQIFHRIKAYLYDNPLTENPNDFIAKVISERALSIKAICESAANRGRADISAASMQHATELFLKEMAYQLCNGYSVNIGYFTAGILIKGVFDSPTENFDPEKHSILFQFNQGDKLRKELSSIEVEILGVAESGLNITQVLDVKSGSINDLITPMHILKITGHRLKIAGENPDVGIFFIDQDTEEVYQIDPTDIVTNNPSSLMIMIPNMPEGTYKLQITTQFSKTNLLKEPRTVVFDKVLTLRAL